MKLRVGFFDGGLLIFASWHSGQQQRVHPPPPSLALIRCELSWKYGLALSCNCLAHHVYIVQ